MRPQIYDPIFDYAKKQIEKDSQYGCKVLKHAPTESKVFPLVIIPECKIILDKETLRRKSTKEKEYRIIFNIEIYTSDKTINNRKTARQSVMSDLIQKIYCIFEDYFGLLGEELKPLPNADVNIMRTNIIFTGRYKNKTIHRR